MYLYLYLYLYVDLYVDLVVDADVVAVVCLDDRVQAHDSDYVSV